jgi:hypothetical protein
VLGQPLKPLADFKNLGINHRRRAACRDLTLESRYMTYMTVVLAILVTTGLVTLIYVSIKSHLDERPI